MEFTLMRWFESLALTFYSATPADFGRLMLVVIVTGFVIGRYTSRS